MWFDLNCMFPLGTQSPVELHDLWLRRLPIYISVRCYSNQCRPFPLTASVSLCSNIPWLTVSNAAPSRTSTSFLIPLWAHLPFYVFIYEFLLLFTCACVTCQCQHWEAGRKRGRKSKKTTAPPTAGVNCLCLCSVRSQCAGRQPAAYRDGRLGESTAGLHHGCH